MFSCKNLIAQSKNNLKGNYLKYFIVILISSIVSFMPEVLNYLKLDFIPLFLLYNLSSLIISAFVVIYISIMDLNIAKGKENIFPDMNKVFSKYLKCFGLLIVLIVSMYVGGLLLIVPGICAVIYFSQSTYILMDNDDKGIIDCLKESIELMKGNVWNYILLQISFIPYILLSIVTLGIYLFWAIPITEVANANFYLYLKESKEEYL